MKINEFDLFILIGIGCFWGFKGILVFLLIMFAIGVIVAIGGN